MRIELVHTVQTEVARRLQSLVENIVAEERLPASIVVNDDQNLEYSVTTAIRVEGPSGEELTMPVYGHMLSEQDIELIREFICNAWEEFTLIPILHAHGNFKVAA
ncbi:MAG: hypothetical protein HC888_02740 [Candidatus Competibacteraceae bacterium]|nr:hypothetical protein [Candidatus Competibacteraceae bacterium]